MSVAQRAYTDGDSVSQDQHVDARSIAGATADVVKVQETGGRLDFGGNSTGNLINAGTAGAFSSAFSVDGHESLVLKLETSKAAPNMKIRVWRGDANATQGWTRGTNIDVQTSSAQGGSGGTPASLAGGYFHAEEIVVPTYGAKDIKVEISVLGNGNAHVWADAR